MPHLLPKAAEQNSASKQKKQARILQAEKYEVHIFQQAASLFPAWPASSPEPNASRPPAHSFRRQPAKISRLHSAAAAANPSIAKCLFCSFGFQDAKTRGAYFFSIQNHRFRLDRPISPNPLFIPVIQSPTRQFISFRRQPADSLLSYFFTEPYASRPSAHSLPAPAGHYFPPPFFPYRPHNPQPANSFLPAWPANALHFFRPAAASPTRRPNAKRSFARGCSLQGCRWCGRGARVSFFFFMFLFSASLFSLSFSISLAPRLRRDAFIFLFAFLHIFVFYFCFFFLFLFLLFFLFFLFAFFSLYFSSYFLFLLFLCPFFLLFLFLLLFLSLFFGFLFLFLLLFLSLFFFLVFIFASPFLFLSFFLFYFFTLLTPISFLIIQPLADHSFFLFRRQSFPSPPATSRQQQKRKKISAKESTGVEWSPRSERAEGGKTEGRNGAPSGMEKRLRKICILRGKR